MIILVKTELLFLQDAYLREAATSVIEVNGDSVILAETIFYPKGGGQPSDTGRLDTPKGTTAVTHVAKQGNRLIHHLKGLIPTVGDEVYMRLDWNRRYTHMRMHTAQHIVSRIVYDRFGAQTAGNQIREEYSHIDFAPATFKSSDLPSIEDTANEIIKQDKPVIVEIISRKELEVRMGPNRSDLTKLPISVKNVRLICVKNYDAYPCAGTHVRSTGELVGLKITKRKSKGKGTIRITYELAKME